LEGGERVDGQPQGQTVAGEPAPPPSEKLVREDGAVASPERSVDEASNQGEGSRIALAHLGGGEGEE